jgi:hypothetical protein
MRFLGITIRDGKYPARLNCSAPVTVEIGRSSRNCERPCTLALTDKSAAIQGHNSEKPCRLPTPQQRPEPTVVGGGARHDDIRLPAKDGSRQPLACLPLSLERHRAVGVSGQT